VAFAPFSGSLYAAPSHIRPPGGLPSPPWGTPHRDVPGQPISNSASATNRAGALAAPALYPARPRHHAIQHLPVLIPWPSTSPRPNAPRARSCTDTESPPGTHLRLAQGPRERAGSTPQQLEEWLRTAEKVIVVQGKLRHSRSSGAGCVNASGRLPPLAALPAGAQARQRHGHALSPASRSPASNRSPGSRTWPLPLVPTHGVLTLESAQQIARSNRGRTCPPRHPAPGPAATGPTRQAQPWCVRLVPGKVQGRARGCARSGKLAPLGGCRQLR
jgi:hypothetical protein